MVSLEEYFFLWLTRLSDRGVLISAYVMMPNHIHLLVYVHSSCRDFNLVLGEAKRFMAYEIVKRLKLNSENAILKKLQYGVQLREILKGKKHQVFRLSFDASVIEGINSLNRVAEYIHHNPVKGKWNLVDDFTTYIPSSAAFYHLGQNDKYVNVDFRYY